ncbi:MAG: ABC transporter substrate-binding protein, partial [Candidatus Methylomirabilales bacterium]
MKAIALLVTLTLGLLAAPLPAEAQKAGKVYRIGFLRLTDRASPSDEAFWQGLRELGYVDYKDFVIEERLAGGETLLPRLAAELVRLKVDLIFADSTPAALAAKNATRTIPVVAIAGDPVGSGIVASLARPGGNVTGLASLTPELTAKRLEFLKEVAPEVSRVVALWDASEPGAAPNLKETQIAARALGVKLLPLEVRGTRDLARVFAAVTRERADAIIITLDWDPLAYPPIGRILDIAEEKRMPAMYSGSGFVEAGGLMSYGLSAVDLYRRAAQYVDKILKGAKPADLPVEQPTRFELVINMKTAKALGITFPDSILIRA